MKKQKSSRPRFFLKLFFSLVLLLAGVEGALQAAHYTHKALEQDPALPNPGAPVILCVGDSHTYGVKVSPEKSYPGQLQYFLDKKGIAANVINKGIPGQNTSELRMAMLDLIENYDPAAVVILCGANNEWNKHLVAWSNAKDGKRRNKSFFSRLDSLWRRFAPSFRTYRLLSYLYNSWFRDPLPMERELDREGQVHFHEWRGKGDWDSPKAVFERTRRDFQAITGMIEDAGAEPILLTYPGKPGSPMGGINYAIRDTAGMLGVRLVDIDRTIRPMLTGPDGEIDSKTLQKLFLTQPGETHLDGPGYKVVAEKVYQALTDLGVLRDEEQSRSG